jgi:nitrogenase-associated protein
MAHIIFYEKPGCINNTKQKEWLEAAGHTIEACSILEHPWEPEDLCTFLQGDDPANWFNRTAPAIKEGKLTPERFGAHEALAAMVVSPILIRRPLMQIGTVKLQGFDKAEIDRLIGLSALPGNEKTVAQLDADNLTLCPKLASNCG